jgi:DNA primase
VVRVATLPEGEDPDTYARTQGAAAVTAVITGAMDVFDRKVQLLERGGWFGDLQRKRRALDRLLPTIRAATDPVTRDLYLARASAAAGIAREVLLAELHTVRRNSSVRSASGGDARARGEPSATGPGAPGGPGGPGGPGVTASVAAGPYRSVVEQASAEADLLRVALTQPVWMDRIIEEIGKLEEEAAAAEGDGGEVPGWEDGPGPGAAFRDEVFRALYLALLDLGPEAAPEILAERLPPAAVRVFEELRAEPAAVVDARATVDGAVRKLRGRALDARVRALEQLLPLAEGGEKDALTLRIKRLADEKRALGVPSWGSVRRR